MNGKEILDWLKHIGIAVIIGLLVVNFVAQRTIVYGSSMQPTLHHGNNLIIEKITIRMGKLNYGDIVVIKTSDYVSYGKQMIIKRIVALENDRINIKNGNVYVNGEQIDEPYIGDKSTLPVNQKFNDIVVPENHIYVLGDNREPNASNDSRVIGPIEVDRIKGKAVLRIYPFTDFGTLE